MYFASGRRLRKLARHAEHLHRLLRHLRAEAPARRFQSDARVGRSTFNCPFSNAG